MGKLLTQEQIEAEMLKDAKAILTRCLQRIKKTGGRIGRTEVSMCQETVFIMIESNLGQICRLIEEECGSSRLKISLAQEFDGQYDWAADVYMKPSGNVWFKRI